MLSIALGSSQLPSSIVASSTFCLRFLHVSQATATRFRLAGSTRLLSLLSAAFSSAVVGRLPMLAGEDPIEGTDPAPGGMK